MPTPLIPVLYAVATGVDALAAMAPGAPSPVEIVCHGGEPLAIGRARFVELLAPFESLRMAGRVQHKVQTGAPLITDE